MRQFAIILLSSLLFVACAKDKANEEKTNIGFSKKAIDVKVSLIEDQMFDQQIVANGKIEASKKADLRFNLGERITNINVKNGEHIRKNEIIATQDNGILQNQIEKALIAQEKAKSKLEEEKINYGFDRKLNNTLNSTVSENLNVKSGVKEALNELANAQLVYDQTILRAPFSGVVANLDTKVGNYVNPSDIFCTLISMDKMEIIFGVLEGELSEIYLGQIITLRPFGNTDNTYSGKISEINPFVDENGMITIKAAITSKSTRLYEGMNCKVFINSPLENVVVIPKEALVLRSNREVVFTLENGLAKWNYVEIQAENSKYYALKSGLVIGDSIITSGNLNLSHDAFVTPLVE